MVVLNRIYTRAGDDGPTALGTGERRKKYDLRIAAYGTLDELNAAIGLARVQNADRRDLSGRIKLPRGRSSRRLLSRRPETKSTNTRRTPTRTEGHRANDGSY